MFNNNNNINNNNNTTDSGGAIERGRKMAQRIRLPI